VVEACTATVTDRIVLLAAGIVVAVLEAATAVVDMALLAVAFTAVEALAAVVLEVAAMVAILSGQKPLTIFEFALRPESFALNQHRPHAKLQ
jgi:hypothetical protein